MNPKIKWLRDKIARLDMQGMIISNPLNIKYLLNIDAEGVLLLTRKENIYITDSRYIEHVNTILTIDDDIIVWNVTDVSQDDYENFFMFCENVGFEENYVTYAKYKEYIRKYKINNLIETEHIIEKQRLIKDEEEIKNIQTACNITDNCFEYLKTYIKKGMTEIQIAKAIENYFLENGADGIAFDTIVASGENSSMPHAVPTNRKISSGDIITIDMGCKYKGYCSDMTRTIFVEYVQEYIKPIYDLVLTEQKKVQKELKEGITTKTISKIVEVDFKQKNKDLIHALGHSIGLEVHEEPILSSRAPEIMIKENMVFANEPGIYISGKFGVRIEDTILINKDNCESLTKSDKEYCIIQG